MALVRFPLLPGLALIVLGLSAAAQERERPVPPSRPIDAEASPVDTLSSGFLLPSIELPEFVVTGTFVIQPPAVQKRSPAVSSGHADVVSQHSELTRDAAAFALDEKPTEGPTGRVGHRLRGMVKAGWGTFWSPDVGIWVGGAADGARYEASARYQRTKGFAANTDRAGASAAAAGSFLLESAGVINQTRIDGDLSVSSDVYRFYGSSFPALQRSCTAIGLHAGAFAGPAILYPTAFGIKLSTLEVADSSSTMRESGMMLLAGGDLSVWGVPWTVIGSYHWATLSRGSRSNLSLAELSVSSPRWALGVVRVQAELHGWIGAGTSGPTVARVSPRLLLGAEVREHHMVTLAYRPSVRFQSLQTVLRENPYVAAESPLRHTFAAQHIGVSVVSRWSQALRTSIGVEVEALRDLPLFADSAGRGVWDLAYEGITRRTIVRGELVANITPIDYFAVGGSTTETTNRAWGEDVPYVPRGEASAVYAHVFPFAVTVMPELRYHGPRGTGRGGGGRLPAVVTAHLRVEAGWVRDLRLALRAENLTDQMYDVWKGYRARPFSLTVEARYSW